MITHPTAAELVTGVAAWMPVDGSAPPFAMRVARNALEIAGRDLTLGPAADARAAARMRELLGQEGTRDELDRALVAAIRGGTMAAGQAGGVGHRGRRARGTPAIDQPRCAHQLTP